MSETKEKYQRLISLLQQYPSLCVAYSGGIDSTFLLRSAVKALGPSNVTALYASSALNSAGSVIAMRETLQQNFDTQLKVFEVEVFPLKLPDFGANCAKRCYHCKNGIYGALKKKMAQLGFSMLADGTNFDDLQSDRPGYRAVLEHQVITPLVEAGLRKSEIRELARARGISNFDLPSNSCLATRIPRGRKITNKRLRVVEEAENRLESLGLHGTRVRIYPDYTVIEIQQKDWPMLTDKKIRATIESLFSELGLFSLSLALRGR